MYDPTTIATQRKSKQSSQRKRILAVSALLVLTFASGWAFGSGRVSLTSVPQIARSGNVESINFDEVEEAYRVLKENFDGELDQAKVLDGLKSGLASATDDPYTEYFNAEDSLAFQEELSGSFEGIGAELGKDGPTVVIIAPIAGSPAEKAGIRPKDAIIAVDDESLNNITISEAVKRIRGKAGTNVKLTLVRNGERVDVTITRAKISVPSVKWEVRNGIGLLTISRFSEDTSQLAREAAEEFRRANVRAVVLDLRNNPGGLLDKAVSVSSLWLDNGKVVLQEKRGDKVVKTLRASGTPLLKGVKTVVLINEGSASASEIVAGALHDNGVATLMGTKSYGKGSVQQVVELQNGGTLKVTIARWFTPNDKNIDKEGIAPDTEVKPAEDDAPGGKDTVLDTALQSLN